MLVDSFHLTTDFIIAGTKRKTDSDHLSEVFGFTSDKNAAEDYFRGATDKVELSHGYLFVW